MVVFPRGIRGMCSQVGSVRPPRVLFCGYEWPNSLRLSRERLPGWDMRSVDRSCVQETIASYRPHVIVPLMYRLDRETIQLAARSGPLKLIHQFGAGLEGVDTEAAKDLNIPVLNIPAAQTPNAAACAEHAIFLALSLLRHHCAMEKALSDRMLGYPMGSTLQGKSLLVLGFGAIAKESAVRFRAMGVRVCGFRLGAWPSDDRMMVDDAGSMQGHHYSALTHAFLADLRILRTEGGRQRLVEMASVAEILLVCTPLTAETRSLVDGEVLRAMPPGGIVVNVARGSIVDRSAALEALEGGHLGGFATDVFWKEPFDAKDEQQGGVKQLQELRNKGCNVVMTPHVAGTTDRSMEKMADIFSKNLASGFPGSAAAHGR